MRRVRKDRWRAPHNRPVHEAHPQSTGQTMATPSPQLFFNDTATTEIYTLSLHDALPILRQKFLIIFVLMLELKHFGYIRRSEEHTSELQSLRHLVCRLLLEKNDATIPTPQTRSIYRACGERWRLDDRGRPRPPLFPRRPATGLPCQTALPPKTLFFKERANTGDLPPSPTCPPGI